MNEEINDQIIIKNITYIISDFLSENLPEENRERYLEPFLPDAVKSQIFTPSDLIRHDLYCNLRVLIGNQRFFRDAGILSDGTVKSCAHIVLSYRNRVAHFRPLDVVLSEHLLLEYISINRLVSILPTRKEIQDKVEETRAYVGSAFIFIAKEYFNSELASNKDKIQIFLESQLVDVAIEGSYKEPLTSRTDVKISTSESKQLLRRLREDIQNEFEDIPAWGNLLRETVLREIVEKKIVDEASLKKELSVGRYKKTDPRQFIYFDRIKSIIEKL